jgi:hypothetical protein
VLSLSAGDNGFRVVTILIDESGRPIGASDGVVYRQEIASPGHSNGERTMAWLHESLSGRLEAGSSFRGSRWISTSILGADGTARDGQRNAFEVSDADVEGLRALVAEVLRRLPPR